MSSSLLAHSIEVNLTASLGHIQQELVGEGAVLNVSQNLLHSLLGVLGDDLGTGHIVTKLSGVGYRVTHTGKTTLVNQVNDQFHLMDTFKVSIGGVITGLNQGLKTGLHQSANAAAQNCLLAEQVSFSFGLKGGFQYACTGAADTQRISQRQILSLAGSVLLNSNQAGNTLANLILAANSVAGALGRDHGNVHVCRGLDKTEVDVKAVSKHQHIAGGQIGSNILFIHLGLQFVVDQNHNNISLLGSLSRGINLKALSLSLGPGFAALIQTDDNVAAGILQVFGMSMALRTVTDNGNLFVLQQRQLTIFLIVNFTHNT